MRSSIGAINLAVQRPLLPPGMFAVAAVLACVGLLGTHALLAIASVLALLFGASLLYRPGESPILLFVFCFQWLQASVKIFLAAWLGCPLSDVTPRGGDVELAITLSLAGLLFLAVGMRLGAGRWRRIDAELVRQGARAGPVRDWFLVYAAALSVATFAQGVAWQVPGLEQPLLAVARMKWAFYWMLAYVTFLRSDADRKYWLAAFCLEFMLGFGAYFSDFKTVLVFTFLAVFAAGTKLTPRRLLGLLTLGSLIVFVGIVWTAIKPEYRAFASGGKLTQSVVVDYSARVSKIEELVGKLDGDAMNKATVALIDRIAYVDFFALVLNTVPQILPHEEGALWWDAITRPLMPRLFFPNKASIDDSTRTNFYTGREIVSPEQTNVSMSIGYMGESYIDFGEIGMMGPIFLFGLMLGRIYNFFLNFRFSRGILGMGLATAILYGATFLESSITKVFGGLIVSVLTAFLIARFATPRVFRWVVVAERR